MSTPDQNVSVVLLFDQPSAVELLQYAFRTSFPQAKLVTPRSAHLLLDRLKDIAPAAVITSYRLYGDLNGLVVAQKLRAQGFGGPILMVSNSDEMAFAKTPDGIDEFLSFARWSEIANRLLSLLCATPSSK